jgi:3-methyladenine DNA glycosylase AlkC
MARRTTRTSTHPAQRFVPAGSMERGGSLKDVIGPHAVELLAESLVAVRPAFDARRFRRRALAGLAPLALMERGQHVARALSEELPADFDEAARILIDSLGPQLTKTEGNGLAVFFYLPHSCFIAQHGVNHFEAGMRACHELTRRFTAEYCVRPFLVAHQQPAVKLLARWAGDRSPHVRRLVSEGSRPRLPWGLRLKAFQADPRPTLALLERLKDDPELYVRRSVANHLGDILKDNPDAAYQTCRRWLREASTKAFDPALASARFWLIRHAVRLPAKQGDKQALRLRELAARR